MRKSFRIIEGLIYLPRSHLCERRCCQAKETFHSTARQAAEIARKANVKRLVIGHYSARYEELHTLKKEADEIFPGLSWPMRE
jgi:RNAse Z (EC 3.1.26.11)